MARARVDPAELEIFKNLFHSVAEEMGAALRRSAFSPNIKERRDYSCAVFDGARRVVAMGDHMPVHLGSMPTSVAAAVDALPLSRGDIAMLNDPYAGGTHLPDITLVMPVFVPGHQRALFYVANRAHHADVGGARPASMGLSEEIYQEGLRIPPVLLVREGEIARDVMALVLANVRTPTEREGDLAAQVAACRLGERRLTELAQRYRLEKTSFYLAALHAYAERLMRAALRRIPDSRYHAEDFLDDDGYGSGPVRLRVAIRIFGERARVDFAGSAPACRGSVNAVMAITTSAVCYVFRCLLGEEVPACAGLIAPIEVVAPKGSVVNAEAPAAVAAGNVETSQRIVDVLLRALAGALPRRIPAASSGTMNNLSFGGFDSKSGRQFAYYETIAGGMGARPTSDGLDAVHTHMTNSLNTPIEALESTYPVRVRRYAVRRGSGGRGAFRGGDGVTREIEFLTSVRGSILSDRRKLPPYGLAGGEPGQPGLNLMMLPGGKPGRLKGVGLESKAAFEAPAGTVLRIETPGGGGWGNPHSNRGRKRRGPNNQHRRFGRKNGLIRSA
jgi:N-methylhydantoinase B